jgi:thioredoxin:protein disulfide reductase
MQTRISSFLFFLLLICVSCLLPSEALALNLEDAPATTFSHQENQNSSQPFSLQTELNTATLQVIINFYIEPGYHLYQNQFSFNSKAAQLGEVQFPTGEMVEDPLLGPQIVYHHFVSLKIPLQQSPVENPFQLTVHYQGCKGDTFCLPPLQKTFIVDLQHQTIQELLPTTLSSNNLLESIASSQSPPSPSFFWTLLSFLGLGLLLSFSPCVLPMLPIITGMLMESHQRYQKRN